MYNISKLYGCHGVYDDILIEPKLSEIEKKDNNSTTLVWFSMGLFCDLDVTRHIINDYKK